MMPARRRIELIGGAILIGLGGVGCRTPAVPMPAPLHQEVPPAATVGQITSLRQAEVRIVTTQGEGTVVVNRMPMGLAPQTVLLPVTPQGFLAEPVVIAVRFIARDVTEASMTVDLVLETTDRPPPRLEFSRDGARRVFSLH